MNATAQGALLAVLGNIRAWARRLARGDADFADELAQSIALRLLASWPRFQRRWDGTLRHAGGLARGIARSVAFNMRRAEATYRRHLSRLARGETRGYRPGPLPRAKRPAEQTPVLS